MEAIFNSLISNGMLNSACIKLALICCKKVTHGKCLSHDDLHNCTLIASGEEGPFCDHSAGMKLVTRAPMHNNSLNLEDYVGDSREAVIIDKDGFLSRISATNIFMVKDGKIFATPIAKCGLPKFTYITVWITGTMGEMTPIVMIAVGNGEVVPVTKRVLAAYKIEESGMAIPFNHDES